MSEQASKIRLSDISSRKCRATKASRPARYRPYNPENKQLQTGKVDSKLHGISNVRDTIPLKEKDTGNSVFANRDSVVTAAKCKISGKDTSNRKTVIRASKANTAPYTKNRRHLGSQDENVACGCGNTLVTKDVKISVKINDSVLEVSGKSQEKHCVEIPKKSRDRQTKETKVEVVIEENTSGKQHRGTKATIKIKSLKNRYTFAAHIPLVNESDLLKTPVAKSSSDLDKAVKSFKRFRNGGNEVSNQVSSTGKSEEEEDELPDYEEEVCEHEMYTNPGGKHYRTPRKPWQRPPVSPLERLADEGQWEGEECGDSGPNEYEENAVVEEKGHCVNDNTHGSTILEKTDDASTTKCETDYSCGSTDQTPSNSKSPRQSRKRRFEEVQDFKETIDMRLKNFRAVSDAEELLIGIGLEKSQPTCSKSTEPNSESKQSDCANYEPYNEPSRKSKRKRRCNDCYRVCTKLVDMSERLDISSESSGDETSSVKYRTKVKSCSKRVSIGLISPKRKRTE